MLGRALFLGLWTTSLVLGATTAASAQDSSQPAGAASEQDEAVAREHFEIGRRYYDMGEFRRAAEEFEEAYRISNRPALLMNIYLSHRDAAEPAAAARALRAYLESDHPSAADRPGLETRLRALERQVEEASRAAEATEGTAAQPSEPTPQAEPAALASRQGPDVLAPALVLGAGGALVLAGAGTGIATVVEHGALEDACPDQRCSEAEAGRIDTVRGLGIATDVLLGVGVAAAAAGLVWLIVELGADDGSESDASATLQCGGLACSVRGSF